jgi:hypothetical protein
MGSVSAAAGLARASVAQPGATPASTPVVSGTAPHLLVADRNVAKISVYSIPALELTGELEGIEFGVHGGALQLADGRVLFADVANEEIVALTIGDEGAPEITQRVAARLGGGVSWISANPTLTHIVVGSLAEESESQFLNVVELETFDNTALEFQMAEQEEIHGWLLGEPLNLYVAIGGQIDSYVLEDLVAGNADPVSSVQVELGSHGGATDGRNQRLFYTTAPGTGFDVLDASSGPAEYLTQIPWDIDGLSGGRNARPRVLRDGAHIFGVMAPEMDDPGRWAEATVSNHITNMDDLTAVRLPISSGWFAYRWGVTDTVALWAGYNATGGNAFIIDADPSSETFGMSLGSIALEVPTGAAVVGEDPTGGEYYFTAITPDASTGFVAVNGDGYIEVIDIAARTISGRIELSSPLTGGGYLTVVQAGIPLVDLWGR